MLAYTDYEEGFKVTGKSLYRFEPFTVFDGSTTDRSSNKDNKEPFGCSIEDFNICNKIVSYSCILDLRMCVLYFHHTFR